MDILYLSRDDVRKVLPSPADQLALVEETYRSMRDGAAQLPPKPAIHPRDDTFLHAMPAYLADLDVAALKWIGGSSGNKARGLPYLSGLIVVNDTETAAPLAIMDAAEITAARTAAVTGLCIRAFAADDWNRVGIVGFGEQGRAHARLIRELNNDAVFVVNGGNGEPDDDGPEVTVAASARDAVRGADIVITAIPFGAVDRPFVMREWIDDGQLVLPIDFDAAVDPSVAEAADLFVVDDMGTFDYYRGLGNFAGWPSPSLTLADALSRSDLRPSRPLCCNLGVATLDAAFASHVLKRALADEIGLPLPGSGAVPRAVAVPEPG